MSKDQLDLLSWTPPCKVLVFPVKANVGNVSRCASMLLSKQGNAVDRYWQKTVQSIANRLLMSGVPLSTTQSEVDKFHEAVQREMQRLTAKGKPS